VEVKSFYIVPKLIKFHPELTLVLSRLREYAKQSGIRIIEKKEEISKSIHPLIITVGGDGTALEGFKIGADTNSPVVTINLGKLGFLADINPKDAVAVLQDILEGNYVEEKRMLLKDTYGNIAANEFYVSHVDPGKLFHYSVYIDDVLSSKESADGVIVATPTGSTAYSLAAGGAILSPSMKAIQIVPVAPHTLTGRPLVVSYKSKIEIDPMGQGFYVKADGNKVRDDGRNEFTVFEKSVTVLHPKDWNFYSVLNEKLDWSI